MRATVVDLRYRMREVLKALRKNEKVDILYHGKVTGTIYPAVKGKKKREIKTHPFFGMHEDRGKEGLITEVMDKLRGGRHRAL